MIEHAYNSGDDIAGSAAAPNEGATGPAGIPLSVAEQAAAGALGPDTALPPNDAAPPDVRTTSATGDEEPAPDLQAPQQGAGVAEGQAGVDTAEQPVSGEDVGQPRTTEDAHEAADQEAADHKSAEPVDDEEDVQPLEETPVSDEPPLKNWYILKVQSNREDSIREGLQRRVAIAGLDKYFGDIIVPTEMVSEFKGGKKRVVKRKLYPGYLVVHMEINEDTWFLVRETPGIGDFTGSAGKPTPMAASEVARIVAKQEEKSDEAPKLKIDVKQGDRVKINEGTFENFEGEVDNIDEANGRVTVMINIFGRSTPVELEYWQIEKI